MLWYNPTLDQDCPSWVYASWALGLFLYQTFDAVDGMQAYVTIETILFLVCRLADAQRAGGEQGKVVH